MAAARLEGKPVMIDFTGFGCVNCRKMEAAVWTDAKVADMLNNKYVLISLYVDDKTPLPEQMTVTDTDGTQRTLRTVGDKWSYLQRHKFGSNTQPMYAAAGHLKAGREGARLLRRACGLQRHPSGGAGCGGGLH